MAILLDDTWLGIIKVAERKAARETIDSLCSALVQTCDSILKILLCFSLLCKMLRRALSCSTSPMCLHQQMHCSGCCHVGCVVLVWRKELRATICKNKFCSIVESVRIFWLLQLQRVLVSKLLFPQQVPPNGGGTLQCIGRIFM